MTIKNGPAISLEEEGYYLTAEKKGSCWHFKINDCNTPARPLTTPTIKLDDPQKLLSSRLAKPIRDTVKHIYRTKSPIALNKIIEILQLYEDDFTVTTEEPTGLNPTVISQEIRSNHHFLTTGVRGVMYHYNPERGIWEPKGEEVIQRLVKEKLGLFWRRHIASEVEGHIRACTYDNPAKLGSNKRYIVVKNGVLDLLEKKLLEFSPEYYEITALPVEYNPDVECPKIEQFLSDVLRPEDVPMYYELAGYCLLKDYPIARFFIFYGSGANGKSKALGLLRAFLGEDNVSSLTLQALTSERGFRASQLHGKLANICGDIPPKPLQDLGLLKQVTGGDKVTLERKYHDPFDAYCYAKLIFSANEVPDSRYDKTDAFYRRAILIPFPNTFPPDDPKTDPNILDKITTPEELSGLLNKAIEALHRLLQRGHFINEKAPEVKRVEYTLQANPIQFFAENFLEQTLDPEAYITNQELYSHYVAICHALKKLPTSSNVFSREVRRYATYAQPGWASVDGKQNKAWRGVKIRWDVLDKFIKAGAIPVQTPTGTTDTTVFPPIVSNKNKQDIIYCLPQNTTYREKTVVSVGSVVNPSNSTPLKWSAERATLKTPTLRERCEEVFEAVPVGGEISVDELVERTGLMREGVLVFLGVLKRDGLVFEPRPGVWRRV